MNMIAYAEFERTQSKIVRLRPKTPPLSYKLQNVVYVADRGYGASPCYAVEFENADGGWSGLEGETNDGAEALSLAWRVYHENLDRKYGVRLEFVGPADLEARSE